MHLSKFFLISTILFFSFSLPAFAHEAPVVDIQQQNNSANTQTEGSTGDSWQTVPSDSNNANSTQENAWQPVTSQSSSSSAPSNSQSNNAQPSTPIQEASPAPVSGSVDKRVTRLEQQMSNFTQMNLPQQVSDLQQQNAKLQGELEVAQHSLQTLTDQQKLYYQDVEQQISQLNTNSGNTNKKTSLNDNGDNDNSSSLAFTKKNNITENNTNDNNVSDNNSEQNTTSNDQTSQINLLNQKQMPSLTDADSYKKAFSLLSDKHFDSAQTAFQRYVKDYPKGRFSVNAHFWLGEIALMHEKYNMAATQFQTVVTQYPKSNQVPDAKLKIAMIHAATGKMELARTEFTQIRKLYPGTTAAQLANIRLQQLANATSVDSQ